jgi:hypothetical protein
MQKEEVAKMVSVVFNRAQNSLETTFDSMGYVQGYKLICMAQSKEDFKIQMEQKIPAKTTTIQLPKQLIEGLWILEIYGTVNNKAFFKKQQFVK